MADFGPSAKRSTVAHAVEAFGDKQLREVESEDVRRLNPTLRAAASRMDLGRFRLR